LAISVNHKLNKVTHLLNQKLSLKTTKRLGVILAILAAIFVGTLNVVGKTLVDPQYSDIDSLNPINLALILGLITGLFFHFL